MDWTTTTNSDGTVEATGGGGSVLWILVVALISLALALPSISVSVRRLHDTNRSGWWYWIGFVPCIGGIWYVILMLTSSSPGQNQYG